jgi:hypothetical protein
MIHKADMRVGRAIKTPIWIGAEPRTQIAVAYVTGITSVPQHDSNIPGRS